MNRFLALAGMIAVGLAPAVSHADVDATAGGAAASKIAGPAPGRTETAAAGGAAPTSAAANDSRAAVPAGPSAPAEQKDKAAAKAPADRGWTLFGALRVRVEDQNFFPTPRANGAYTFVGDSFRFGVQRQTKAADYWLEMEQDGLFNLPTKAIAPAPQGQLGHGATYRAINGGKVANLFLKQAFVRIKDIGSESNSLRLGRFEYGDGLETTPADPSLNWLKQNRIGQRLIGPFGYTIVTRSFDGFQFTNNTPKGNLTVLGVFPTRGAFDLNGWDSLPDIKVAYVAGTLPRQTKTSASDMRLFFLYYEDDRSHEVKTDNRPAAVRGMDTSAIQVETFGGHYARVMNAGPGKLDVLGWIAGQVGTWGVQNHGAWAFSAEAGYQFPKTAWKPWLRAGYYMGSGDGNPNNGQHGTFFPVLPTARVYARYPFFAEANLDDAFVQAIAKPSNRLTLRSDVRWLRLADSHDLWYSGGGAFNNSSFGYQGRPSGGKTDLATLADLSADYQLSKTTALTLYGAYANGGGVVASSFTGRDSVFVYGEMNVKF